MAKKPLSPEDMERKKQRRLLRKEKRRQAKERDSMSSDDKKEEREAAVMGALKQARETALKGTPKFTVQTELGKFTLPAYVPIPELPPAHYAYFQGLMRILCYAQRMKYDMFVQVDYHGPVPLPGNIPMEVK